MSLNSALLRSALAVSLTAAALFTGRAPAASAEPCPDVELVFARGTGEPPGIGRVGQALADQLGPRIAPRSLGVYAVNYPAGINFLTTADGANDAAGHIAWMADQCPGTRVVLGGFSQGAAAVSMLAGVPPIGDRIGLIGSAPALPPPSADRVAAVAVFGNPGNRFGTPLSGTGQFAGRTIDLCSPGDPICVQGGRLRAAHSAYELPPYPDQAAGFVAGHL
ncbi:cutinase family protein [Mycobacterium sp. TNTM28]|uniref:Cutinase family protein n=1 Tax=[Mycobacterium] fortunisiensis TaxID=2600579 RepID=A0ABS6KIY1_9MYCO|nr:cutinase family protein [[Mycobacterium] fortunisiensis]MBU9763478.1 cutinase family protein [[Mycobacterium] fortunisiensis]